MKNSILNIATILVFVVAIMSCSKDSDSPAPVPAPTPQPISDVFGAGSDNSATSQQFFYKNTTRTNLLELANESNQIQAMYVDGNDVYITGGVSVSPATGNTFSQACYWKNNVRVNLPHFIPATGGNYATTFAITIVNGDIYALGVNGSSFSDRQQLIVWKNGVLNYFASVATGSIYGGSIAVYGNDIYVAGAIEDGTFNKAAYWKNGVITTLSTTLSSSSDIKVDQTGVHVLYGEYTGGGVATAVKYWKDGVNTTISTQQPEVGKMLIKGSDAYVTGAERETGSFIPKACYWKNGVKTELNGGITLIGQDIKIGTNGDVFVSSRLSNGGYAPLTYWQNNVKKTIGTSSDNFSCFDINKALQFFEW